MSGDYFSDVSTVTVIGLAAVLSYTGYDLVRIVSGEGNRLDFQFIIPEKELRSLHCDFIAGTCALTDAQGFCKAYAMLLRKMKHARIEGTWEDHDLIKLAEAQGATI